MSEPRIAGSTNPMALGLQLKNEKGAKLLMLNNGGEVLVLVTTVQGRTMEFRLAVEEVRRICG